MKFEIRRNEYGDILVCDSCKCEVATSDFDRAFVKPHQEKKMWLCSLCADSFIGNAYQYPEQYECATPEMLAQAIHWLHKQLTAERAQ